MCDQKIGDSNVLDGHVISFYKRRSVTILFLFPFGVQTSKNRLMVIAPLVVSTSVL